MPRYSEDDVNYLRSIIFAEGGNFEKLGMYMLGMTIMNRVMDPDAFPDTIQGVITQPKQFAGYGSKRWNEAWNARNDNKARGELSNPDYYAYGLADSVAKDILNGYFTNDFGGIKYFKSYPKSDEKAKLSGWHNAKVKEGILVTDPWNDEPTTDNKTVMQFYSQPIKKDNSR